RRHIGEPVDQRVDGAVEIDGAAAGFVAVCIVADDPDREPVVRLEEQLAPDEVAVAVVDVALGAAGRIDDMIEAVAADVDGVEAGGEALGDRPGDAARGAYLIEIAVAELDVAAEIEFWPAG